MMKKISSLVEERLGDHATNKPASSKHLARGQFPGFLLGAATHILLQARASAPESMEFHEGKLLEASDLLFLPLL
jgi:hypothetical protein